MLVHAGTVVAFPRVAQAVSFVLRLPYIPEADPIIVYRPLFSPTT